ncbi:MAG: hypothetical protein WBM17_01165 [Anaerolineales bacterium]
MSEAGGFQFAPIESSTAPVSDKKSKLGQASVTLGGLAVLAFALAMLLLNMESI